MRVLIYNLYKKCVIEESSTKFLLQEKQDKIACITVLAAFLHLTISFKKYIRIINGHYIQQWLLTRVCRNK